MLHRCKELTYSICMQSLGYDFACVALDHLVLLHGLLAIIGKAGDLCKDPVGLISTGRLRKA